MYVNHLIHNVRMSMHSYPKALWFKVWPLNIVCIREIVNIKFEKENMRLLSAASTVVDL